MRQKLVQVTSLDQVVFLGIGALGVIAPGVVTDAPQAAGSRGEHHRVVYAPLVSRKDRVSRDAQRIESRYRDAAEDRDVRRGRNRIRTVEAVKPCGQQADAETRVFRIAGTAGEGEVDLFLKGLVGGRLSEIIDDAPQKGLLFRSFLRQRGIGVMECIAVGRGNAGVLGAHRKVQASDYDKQDGEAAKHSGSV